MGPIFKFLNSLRSLAKSKNITIEEAYKFAQQEFGEVSDLLKLQINKIFKDVEAPSIKKPSKKEGEVIEASFKPGRDKTGKVVEESESQLMKRLEEGIQNIRTPENITTGLTRTIAREILMKRGIDLGKGMDPIEIFRGKFGQDALGDVANLADELIEMEAMGKTPRRLEDILEQEGMFDIKMPKEPPQGYTDAELADIQKEIEQEDILLKFDPKDREPNAKGGRVGYDDGGITSLPKGLRKDTTTGEGANIFNMYAEKDNDNTFNMYAERPEKSFKEDLEFIKKLKGGVGTNTILYMVKEAMDKALERGEITKEKHTEMLMPFFGEASERITEKMYNEDMGNYATGGRVGYAYGSGVKLIQLLQKAGKSLKDEIKKAVDDLIPSGDPKLDADMAVDNMLEDLNINRDTLDEYDILDAYGMAYDELKKPLLANIKNKPDSLSPKLIERFELKQKYPGIDEELVTKIVDDPDPQRKAEVLATIEQAFELMKKGKSSDEVLDIMKQMTDRTKQAGGGLSYLSGF